MDSSDYVVKKFPSHGNGWPIGLGGARLQIDIGISGSVFRCCNEKNKYEIWVSLTGYAEAYLIWGWSGSKRRWEGKGRDRNKINPITGVKNKKSWLPPKHDVGGYRQRNFHGDFSEIGKCPKKMGVDGSFYLFVRGTAGAYVGGQINIQNTWNVREHIGIGKLSFETSVAYGVYGISIEVGAGLKATGLYRLR